MASKASKRRDRNHRSRRRRACELTDSASAELPRHSFLSRLYTGTGAFEVVGRRRLWYGISGAIVAVAIVSIVLRGLHLRDRLQGRHHGVDARAVARHVAAGVRRLQQDHRHATPNRW